MTTHAFTPVTADISDGPPRLTEISSAYETVAFLRNEMGLAQREIAGLLGADERTVRRLLGDPGIRLQHRHARRLDDIRDLVSLLQDSLPGEQTGRWLRARNRMLRGERPIELIAADDYARVRDAAEAFIDGDPM
jgi:transcriptional regulator with XRE-family HTH domain